MSRRFRIAPLLAVLSMLTAASSVWGQSRIPAQTSNFLSVTGNLANGDSDPYQVVFFEVPDTISGPIYFAVYDAGLDNNQTDADPDQGNTGAWQFDLIGGSGTLSGSGARNVTLTGPEAYAGTVLGTLSGTGNTAGTDQAWSYFGGVYPSQGEKVGNSYYFKVVATVSNGDKNAFQLDASYSASGTPTGVSGLRAFAYAWTLALRDRGTTNQWLLYPFLPDNATGNLAIHNYDFDGPTDADTLTLRAKTGYAVADPTQSGGAALFPDDVATSLYDITAVETASGLNQRNGTWILGITEDGVAGGDPVINTSLAFASNSADATWAEGTDTAYRIYASSYTPAPADRVSFSPTVASAVTGSSIPVTLQIVDASDNPVPYVRNVYVTVNGSAAIAPNANGTAQTELLTTDAGGFASLSVSDAVAETVTLTVYWNGTGGSSSLASPGSGTASYTFQADLPPTLSSASNLSFFSNAVAPVYFPVITIADSGAANITAANDIRIRPASGLTAPFLTTVTTPTLTVGGVGAGAVNGTVSYVGGVLLIDVTTDFGVGNTLTIGGATSLQVDTASDAPSSGRLEMSVDGGTTWTILDDKIVTVMDPNPTYTWDGSTSTTWTDGTNWAGGAAPSLNNGTENIIVPNGCPNYPVLPAAAWSINNLSVDSAATLTLGGFNLTVNGTLSNAGVIILSGAGRPSKTDADSGTVRYTAAGGAVTDFGATDYFNLELNGVGTYTTSAALTVAGALSVGNAAGILDLNANALSVAGAVSNVGTVLLEGTQAVTLSSGNDTDSGTWNYDGAAGGTLRSFGATDYFNLTVSGTGTFNANGNIAVAGAFSVSAAGAVVDLQTFDLSVSGTLSNVGTIRLDGTQTVALSFGNDVDSGTWIYDGGAGGAVADFGATDYWNLTIAGTGTFNTGADLRVAGALAVNSGTLAAAANPVFVTSALSFGGGTLTSSGTVSVAGDFSRTAGGLSSTGTLEFTGGVAQSFDPTGSTFQDLTVDKSANSVNLTADLTMGGDLTVAAGTLVAGSYGLMVTGSTDNTGTITLGTGAATLTGTVTNSGTITRTGAGTTTSGAVTNNGTLSFTIAGGSAWTVNGDFTSSGTVTNTVTNTLSVSGNVSISNTFSSPTNSTITMTGAGRTINTAVQIGNLATNGAGTTVTVDTNPLNLAGTLTIANGTSLTDVTNDRGITVAQATTIIGTGTLTLGDGTYTFAAVGGTGTFNDSATSTQTTVGGNLTVTTFNHNGGTLRFTGGTTGAYTFNNVVIAGAVTSSGAWTIGGNLTISAGAWTAGANTHQIAGNWTNSVGAAGFVNAGSTIQFTGAVAHVIDGATNFNNLTNIDAGSTLTFTSGQSFGVAGILNLAGAVSNLITVQASAAATFTLNNSAAQTVTFVRVSNSVAGAAGITANNSIDLTGNNTNWTFGGVTWTGTTDTDANLASNWATGVVPGQFDSATIPAAPPNQPVQTGALSLRGLTVQAGASWSNGGQNLTISTTLSNSGTITYTGAGTLTLGGGITTVGGTFVYSGGAVDLHPQLTTYNNLTISGGTITAAVTGRTATGTTSVTGGTFVVPAAVTFNSGTTFSIGAAGTLQISGTLSVAALTSAGTIMNAALNAINASGSVSIAGIFGTPANNTLTMTGNGVTLDSVPTLGSLVVNSAGSITNNAALTLAGNLALTAGTFALGTTDLSVAGNVTRGTGFLSSTGTTGTITLNGSAAQTVNFTASTIPNLSVSNTVGVTLNNTAAFTWNGDCVLSAAGASLALANVPGQTIGGNVRGPGTLDAGAITGANTLTVAGYIGTNGVPLGTFLAPTASTVNVGTDWNVTNFTSGNGTVAFTGTGTLYSGTAFFNLNKITGGTTTLNLDVTATNTATVSAGVLELGIYNLDVTGSLTISGGSLTHGNGALTCASLTVNGGTYDGTGAGSLTVTGPISASSGAINLGGKTVIDVTDLSVTGGATSDFGTATVTATGDLIFTSTGAHTAGTSVITLIGGGGTISVGTVGLTGTVILSGARTLTGAGAGTDIEHLRIGAGSLTVNTGLLLGVGTLEFAGTGDLTANGTASVTAGAGGILWTGASTGGITMGSGALTVNGPYTQTAGAFGAVSVGAGGLGVSGVVTNYGTITVTSGDFSATGVAANFNYGTIQTVTGGTQTYSGSLANYGTLTGVGLVTLASITTPGAGARTVNVGTGGLLVTGAADFSGGTVNGAAVGNPNWDFQGNLTFSAASTVNPAGDILRFSSGNAQTFTTGGLVSFGPISVAKTAATAVTTSGSLTAASLAVGSGIFTVATGTTATFTGAVSVTDTLNLPGTATVEVGANLSLGTLSAASGSTVRLNGGATQIVYPNSQTFGDVAVSNSSIVRWTGTATTYDVTVGAGSTFRMDSTVVPGTVTLNVTAGSTVTNNGAFELNSGSGALTLQGTAASATFTGTNIAWDTNDLTVGNLVYNADSAPTLANGTYVTLNNPVTFSDGIATVPGSTIDVNTRTLTLSAASSNEGTLSLSTGSLAGGANALTNTGAITFLGAGSLAAGTVTNDGSITLAGGAASTGTVQNNAAGTIVFGSVAGATWTVVGNFTSSGSVTNNSVNTISVSGDLTISGIFDGTTTNSTLEMTGTSDVFAYDGTDPIPLGNLIINSSGIVSFTSDCTFDGDITIQAGTLASGNKTIKIAGNWTNSTGVITAFSPGSGIVEFTNPSEAVVSGPNEWYNLRYNQPGGRIRFQRNNTQRIIAGGTFQAIGTDDANRVTITRDNSGDDDYDLDWIPPAQPDPALMWQFDLQGGANTDFQFVRVWYSDARSNPVTYELAAPIENSPVRLGLATIDLASPPEIADTCFMWISGLNVIYSYTEDDDDDGRIDRIRVKAQANLDMNFSGFAVEVDGYEIDTAKGTNGFESAAVLSEFFIHLVEKPYLDGSRTPSWRIVANSTLRGSAIPHFILNMLVTPMTPADTVPPKIAYTLTVPNTADTFFGFSEAVQSGGGGTVTAADLGGPIVSPPVTPPLPGPIGDGDIYGVIATLVNRTVADIVNPVPVMITIAGTITDMATPITDWSADPLYSLFISTSPSYPAGSLPNPISLTSNTHRVSDFLISVPPSDTVGAWSQANPNSFFVWPIWAKDDAYVPGVPNVDYPNIPDVDAAGQYVGFIRRFDGTRFLRDQDFSMQVEDALGLGSAPTILYKSDISDIFRSAVPGIWLPTYAEPDFSGLASYPFTGFASNLTGAGTTPIWDYSFLASDSEIYERARLEFYFRLPAPYPADLYAGRLDMDPDATAIPADWYRRVRPFGIYIRNLVTQKGGVTILNNVIDPRTGERARLHYTIGQAGPVTITVFTLDGDVVRSLQRGTLGVGDYTASWDGRNRAGDPVAPGMYFIRIVAPGIDEIRKVMVVRY